MLNEKLAAGRNIARHLLPSEDSIDGAILDGSRLLASIVEGRLQSRTAASDANGPVQSAIAALGALGEARGHAVTCHQQLTDLRDEAGLTPQAVGCTIGKLGGTAQGSLRAVDVA